MNAQLPGAINVAFYDGHAELVPLEKIWQLHLAPQLSAACKTCGMNTNDTSQRA